MRASKVQRDRGHTDRSEIITFEGSSHDRTLATVAATAQRTYQRGFEPLPAGFTYAPYGDIEALAKRVGPKTCAILVEPIQGEGGVRLPPPGFLKGIRAPGDRTGVLFLVDEVQTGMERTGRMFGFQHEDVKPDALTMAKALGNGLPIGAMLCREELGTSLSAGTHGSTFGGNPVAAANATIELIQDQRMLERVRQIGEYLLAGVRTLGQKRRGAIQDVRGRVADRDGAAR